MAGSPGSFFRRRVAGRGRWGKGGAGSSLPPSFPQAGEQALVIFRPLPGCRAVDKGIEKAAMMGHRMIERRRRLGGSPELAQCGGELPISHRGVWIGLDLLPGEVGRSTVTSFIVVRPADLHQRHHAKRQGNRTWILIDR